MKKSDVWMPLYVGDYLADTGHLDATEHGAYLLLLMHYWRTGPLRDDDDELAIIARVERSLWGSKIGPKVRRFFALGDDGLLHQKRLDAERDKAAGISVKRGKAARERWERERAATGDANADANAVHMDVQTTLPSQSPVHIPSGYEATASASAEEQGEQTIGQRLYGEGLATLAKLLEKPSPEKRDAVASLMRKMQTLAGDDALLLDIILDAGAKPPRGPAAWIRKQIEAKGKAPRLVVDNADPADRWGVDAWCAALPEVEPTTDPEDCKRGKWLWCGKIIHVYARLVCEAARLPASWRGSLDAITGWAADGIKAHDAAKVIERIAGREDYAAGNIRSFAFFNAAVREARRAA